MIQPKAPQSLSGLCRHFSSDAKFQVNGCESNETETPPKITHSPNFQSSFVFVVQSESLGGPRTRERWFHISTAVCCSVLLVHCSMFSPCSASKRLHFSFTGPSLAVQSLVDLLVIFCPFFSYSRWSVNLTCVSTVEYFCRSVYSTMF